MLDRSSMDTHVQTGEQFVSFPIDDEQNLRFLSGDEQKEIVVGLGGEAEQGDIRPELFTTEFRQGLQLTRVPDVDQHTRTIFPRSDFTRDDQRMRPVSVQTREKCRASRNPIRSPSDGTAVFRVETLLFHQGLIENADGTDDIEKFILAGQRVKSLAPVGHAVVTVAKQTIGTRSQTDRRLTSK